jgi:hypothetical protein
MYYGWHDLPISLWIINEFEKINYKSFLQILPNYLSFWDIWNQNILPCGRMCNATSNGKVSSKNVI